MTPRIILHMPMQHRGAAGSGLRRDGGFPIAKIELQPIGWLAPHIVIGPMYAVSAPPGRLGVLVNGDSNPRRETGCLACRVPLHCLGSQQSQPRQQRLDWADSPLRLLSPLQQPPLPISRTSGVLLASAVEYGSFVDNRRWIQEGKLLATLSRFVLESQDFNQSSPTPADRVPPPSVGSGG